jgi:polysaccharide export outer membrane protein
MFVMLRTERLIVSRSFSRLCLGSARSRCVAPQYGAVAGSLAAAIIGLCLVLAPERAFAQTQYRLQPGDSVRVAVLGVLGLDVTGFVRDDGYFLAPLIGDVKAADVPFNEFRSHIVAALDQRPLRLRAHGGVETITAITADEVMVQIVSYRPVFVQGDVRQPGEQVFSPGLTVRQALSRAGSVADASMRSFDPFLSALDYIAERDSLADRLSRLRLEFARVETELATAPDATDAERAGATADEAQAPVSGAESPRIEAARAAETAVGEAERRLVAEDLRSFNTTTALLRERIEVLASEVAVRQEAERTDREIADELRSLLDRGLTQTVRLTEARRQAVDSLARLRSTEAELLESRRRISETERQSRRLAEERRVSLVRDARRLRAEIADAEIRLRAAEAKLAYAGRAGGAVREAQSAPYDLRIMRARGDEIQIIQPSLDTPLQPGDVVELRIFGTSP